MNTLPDPVCDRLIVDILMRLERAVAEPTLRTLRRSIAERSAASAIVEVRDGNGSRSEPAPLLASLGDWGLTVDRFDQYALTFLPTGQRLDRVRIATVEEGIACVMIFGRLTDLAGVTDAIVAWEARTAS